MGLSLYFALDGVALAVLERRRAPRRARQHARPSPDLRKRGRDRGWQRRRLRRSVVARASAAAASPISASCASPGRARACRKRDPRALRYVVLLLDRGGRARREQRLAPAHRWPPSGQATGEAANVSIDAWIDPPRLYRRGAGLSEPAGDAARSPCRRARPSTCASTARAMRRTLSVDGASFTGGLGESMRAPRASPRTPTVRVRSGGRTIGDWRLHVLPDDKPVIAFSSPPARTEHDALKLAFTAGDDYGVVAARAHHHAARPLRQGRSSSTCRSTSASAKTRDADELPRSHRASLCRPRRRYRAARRSTARARSGFSQAGALHAAGARLHQSAGARADRAAPGSGDGRRAPARRASPTRWTR